MVSHSSVTGLAHWDSYFLAACRCIYVYTPANNKGAYRMVYILYDAELGRNSGDFTSTLACFAAQICLDTPDTGMTKQEGLTVRHAHHTSVCCKNIQ